MFTYTYTVTNQFNFINNGLQRFNRAFGDASGMTAILDELVWWQTSLVRLI